MIEKRPFCYHDFLSFTVDEIDYSMKHGTFRNKISQLIKKGEVERLYNSGITFYTLKGHHFNKPMTVDHTMVHNHPLYRVLQNLPLGKRSIHDIRLKFKAPEIWKIVSANPNFSQRRRSGDVIVPSWLNDNKIIKAFVHKTDVVSVTIGCSLCPIPLDNEGIIDFFTLLARTEEKMKVIVDNNFLAYNYNKNSSIPNFKKWVVTMWHFGRDSLNDYYGEKFSVTLEEAESILIRVYAKTFHKGITRIRVERQEYPMKTVEDAIDEKLK